MPPRLTPNQCILVGELLHAKAQGGSYCPTGDEVRTMGTLVRRGLARKAVHPNPRAEYAPPRFEITEAGEGVVASVHHAALAADARFAKRVARRPR